MAISKTRAPSPEQKPGPPNMHRFGIYSSFRVEWHTRTPSGLPDPLRFNNSTDHRALPLSPTYDIYTYSDRAWKDLPEYVIMVDKHLFGKKLLAKNHKKNTNLSIKHT